MRIFFGKYKGRDVRDLPDDYLLWLNSIDLRDRLKAAVLSELAARGLDSESTTIATPAPAMAGEIVQVGFRVLAKRFHPDTGGTNQKMMELNAAAEWLRTRLTF